MAKEAETRQQYITYQRTIGHPSLTFDECGLFVSLTDPWLAASHDGSVHDPSDADHTPGLVEIKKLFSGWGKKPWLKSPLVSHSVWREKMLIQTETSTRLALPNSVPALLF